MKSFLASIVLLLVACASPALRPSDSEMDRVERALAKSPCVGDLKDWDRRYFYGRTINKNARVELDQGKTPSMWIFDHNIVEVDLRQGGFEEFGFGRKSYSDADIEDPPGWIPLDDRSYEMVFGTFNLTSGKLSLRSCGQNMDP